mmetsp:Transcript_97778/g.146605  ORF Transcript_97778/g.146605 Transcript_97778/m.146605 type:complete len:528 (-) Transcript_97778:1833-3416(-)
MEIHQLVDKNGKIVTPKSQSQIEEKDQEILPIISFVNLYHGDNSFFLNSIFNTTIFSRKENLDDFQGIRLIKKPTSDHKIGILELENSFDSKLLKKFSMLAFKASTAIVLSTWFQNLWAKGGVEQAFIEDLFEKTKNGESGNEDFKTSIILCVHDFDKDHSSEQKIKSYLEQEFSNLWEKVQKKENLKKTNPFELNIILFSHYKYQSESFQKQCGIISKMIGKEGVIISNKKYHKKATPEQIFKIKNLDNEAESEKLNEIKETKDENLIQFYQGDKAFSEVLRQSAIEMAELTKSVDENNKIPSFGKKASVIIEKALENFETKAGKTSDVSFISKKKQELEAILDTSLNSIFLKQLSILRELAIVHFKSATINEDVPVDFAFFTADSFFVRESEDSVRPGSYWSYATERTNVHNAIREISNRRKQLISEKIQHAEHQANAFQYLQMQQAQMQAIQQQQYGGGAGNWNIGAAYRPPDSNLNISMGYQQGRTNIQISMVPDEQASLLGPNGFTAGVGPANLGLSLNLNL